MATCTLIEKTAFSQFPLLNLYCFLQTHLTLIEFLFQLCLTTAGATQEFVYSSFYELNGQSSYKRNNSALN
jgi:hypothetical protein